MDERRAFGNKGEDDAACYLVSLGYEVVARGWRCPFGEIDLICIDTTQQTPEVVFVEVKTRKSHESGYPEDSVTPAKLRHLAACAESYLDGQHWSDQPYRFDVIAISTLPGEQYELVHLRGV